MRSPVFDELARSDTSHEELASAIELETPVWRFLSPGEPRVLPTGTTIATARARLAEANAEAAAVIDSEGELVGVVDIFGLAGLEALWPRPSSEPVPSFDLATDALDDTIDGAIDRTLGGDDDGDAPRRDADLALLAEDEPDPLGNGLYLVEPELTIDDMMTRGVATLPADAPLGLVVSVLATQRHAVAVVDGARPMGAITLGDVGRWLAGGIARAWLHRRNPQPRKHQPAPRASAP